MKYKEKKNYYFEDPPKKALEKVKFDISLDYMKRNPVGKAVDQYNKYGEKKMCARAASC